MLVDCQASNPLHPIRVAAREREAVMVVLVALLEVVERVEPETSVLWEAAVVGWSVATLVVEVRLLRAA